MVNLFLIFALEVGLPIFLYLGFLKNSIFPESNLKLPLNAFLL